MGMLLLFAHSHSLIPTRPIPYRDPCAKLRPIDMMPVTANVIRRQDTGVPCWCA